MSTESATPTRPPVAPLLVLLLGLALTALAAITVADADRAASDASTRASSAQVGLLLQSFASGIETDLTSSVQVAVVTGGDEVAYRALTAGRDSGDRALILFAPEATTVLPAAEGSDGRAASEAISALLEDPDVRSTLENLGRDGGSRFVVVDRETGERSILLAAGANAGGRSYVDVRRFELSGAGPWIVDLVDGIEQFAVYASSAPDPATAIIASTDRLPLGGSSSATEATIAGQTMLVEAIGTSRTSVPLLALVSIGALVSIILAAMVHLARRRQEAAVHALQVAREAETARRAMEENLQRSQRMDAVGQLAGGIAHDFNNLLAAITSTTDLVEEAVTSEQAREDLAEIRNAARRGAGLTRRLLSFARRDVEVHQVLDLNAVVADVEPLLRRAVPADIDLRLELHAAPLFVDGDAGEIEQVLLNLVVNARDARTGDHDEIVVRTESDGESVILEVRDAGVGMKPELLERVLEPFFTTRTTTGGTGLGLSIVYGICSRMEGEISIVSVPGEGTTVTLDLPVARSTPASPRPTDIVPAPAALGGERVLLVEDEAPVRRATRRLLERAGHQVVEAASGVDAIGLVEDGFDPTVLVTDVVLPGALNGRDVAERVLEMTPAVRVVFASGYANDIVDGEALTSTGGVLLTKPFTTDSLLAAVAGIDRPTEALA